MGRGFPTRKSAALVRSDSRLLYPDQKDWLVLGIDDRPMRFEEAVASSIAIESPCGSGAPPGRPAT